MEKLDIDFGSSGGGCGACRLWEGPAHPKIPSFGQGGKRILLVTDSPTEMEDSSGSHATGKAGTLLRDVLLDYGIEMDADCRIIHAVRCRPPNNRPPRVVEKEACRQYLWDEIATYRPTLTILLGVVALEAVYGDRWPSEYETVAQWRGFCIPDRKVGGWVVPTYAPTYVRMNLEDPVVESIFRLDIQKALSCLKKPFPKYRDERECVEVTYDMGRVHQFLKEIQQDKVPIAFDYETTGLKPHAKGHRVVSIAVADQEDHAVAFPLGKLYFGSGAVVGQWKAILADPEVPKIAQNMKFEDGWSRVFFGTQVQGWHWDTMLASHTLDNRKGICGLKWQAFTRLGTPVYNDAVGEFLKASEEDEGKFGGNAFNHILDANRDALLLYNGIDPLVTYRLMLVQKREI